MTRLIRDPAGYIPSVAMAFGGQDEAPVSVTPATPLPVTIAAPAVMVTPLAGTAASSTVAGPFTPQPGRDIWVTLTGEWSGSATVLRSVDGGVTRLPLTAGGQPWASFSSNAQEPVGSESASGATYYLDIQIIAGTLAYRVQQ